MRRIFISPFTKVHLQNHVEDHKQCTSIYMGKLSNLRGQEGIHFLCLLPLAGRTETQPRRSIPQENVQSMRTTM